MGFFSRESETQELKPVNAELVPMRYSGEELEHMVGEVYKEKMALQRKLDDAKRKLEEKEEAETKLSAAELFARQLQNEAKQMKFNLERLERERDSWKREAEQAQDALAVESIRKDDLRAVVRDEVVDEMLEALIYENGSWSKQRVKDFVKGFSAQEPTKGDAE